MISIQASAWNGNQRLNFTSHKETADKLDFHLVCLQSEQPCAGSYFCVLKVVGIDSIFDVFILQALLLLPAGIRAHDPIQ